jgi:hypothetical protein
VFDWYGTRRKTDNADRGDPATQAGPAPNLAAMAKIADLLAAGRSLSFEFFPPKTDDGVRALHATLDELSTLSPTFVSVTSGAGGSTKDRTRDIVLDMNRARAFPAMPHLTCMSHTKAEVLELVRDYEANGIENILALAGDPPADGRPPEGEFSYALELVELVRAMSDLSVGVAAFPEVHPARATGWTTGASWRPSSRWPTSASPSSSTTRTITSGWWTISTRSACPSPCCPVCCRPRTRRRCAGSRP